MLSSKVGIFGRYRLIKEKGTKVTQDTGWFNNIILNNGLDGLASWPRSFHNCHVGSGSSTPQVSDIGLGTPIASQGKSGQLFTSGSINSVDGYIYNIFEYEFAEGAAAGNISEVGIGPSNTDLLSRSLIKDENGDPTTITVLSDEILRVFYEFRVYFPAGDQSYTVGPYQVTARALAVNKVNDWSSTDPGWYLADTDDGRARPRQRANSFATNSSFNTTAITYFAPQGLVSRTTDWISGGTKVFPHNLSGTVHTDEPYVQGSYERITKYVVPAAYINDPNEVGISLIVLSAAMWGGSMQFHVDPPIPKTELDELTITVKQTWGRYTPPE